jgi:chromosome condensin MukBEF MukE localization factor
VKQKQVKPPFMDDAEWDAVLKAKSILTEHFQNIGIFINWVCSEKETRFYHVVDGNAFAMENHIQKWADNEFDDPDVGDEEEDDEDDEDN